MTKTPHPPTKRRHSSVEGTLHPLPPASIAPDEGAEELDEPALAHSIPDSSPSTIPVTNLTLRNPSSPHSSGKSWSTPTMSTTKLDMRDIMAQASQARVSNLSTSISHLVQASAASGSTHFAKLSQRQRKQHQQ